MEVLPQLVQINLSLLLGVNYHLSSLFSIGGPEGKADLSDRMSTTSQFFRDSPHAE